MTVRAIILGSTLLFSLRLPAHNAGDLWSKGGRAAGGEDECGLLGTDSECEFDGDREGNQG